MKLVVGFLALFVLEEIIAQSSAVSVQSYVSENDAAALKRMLLNSITPTSDVTSLSYAVKSLALVGTPVPADKQQVLCSVVRKLKAENLDDVFALSGILSTVKSCGYAVTNAAAIINAALVDGCTSETIYKAAVASHLLKVGVDKEKLLKLTQAAMTKDDSASSLAHALHVALDLPGDVEAFVNRVQDCVSQADEIDGKLLQFDGGLETTSLVISAAYRLAEKAKKAVVIKPTDAVKFANYLVSRRRTKHPKSAYYFLLGINTISANQCEDQFELEEMEGKFSPWEFHVPVVFSLESRMAVDTKRPKITIKVTDILGRPIESAKVVLDTATHILTSAVVMSKKQLTPVAQDKTHTLFETTFMEPALKSGFYTLSFTASVDGEKRLVGNAGAEVTVKVMAEILISNAKISVVDREQIASEGSASKLTPYGKLSNLLEADHHQKIIFKFSVLDKRSEFVPVIQAFVQFIHKESREEVTFVAEPDKTKAHKFDVDLHKSSKDFGHKSGKYEIRLIVADPLITNPVSWHLADILLTLPEVASKERTDRITYEKKPNIVHTFREPEKLPPVFISNLFTVLVLCPLLLLFILWIRLGANVYGFPCSLYAIGFHLSLGAIFVLYFVFWLQLNMFQTLKYLLGISLLAFICGNRTLRLMSDKKLKTE